MVVTMVDSNFLWNLFFEVRVWNGCFTQADEARMSVALREKEIAEDSSVMDNMAYFLFS